MESFQPFLGSTVVLAWLHRLSSVFSPLPLSILHEISLYFPPPCLLPVCSNTNLLIHSVYTGMTALSLRPARIPPQSLFCMSGLTHAYVFSACFTTSMVLRIDLISLEIEEIANMNVPRVTPGTVFYRKNVYAFGGKLKKLALIEAEKYSEKTGSWTDLEEMKRPVARPFVCLHHSSIYLLTHNDQANIQLFDLLTERFALLNVSCSVFNTLTVFGTSEGKIYRIGEKGEFGVWEIMGKRPVFERMAGKGEKIATGSSTIPVQRGTKVYFLSLKDTNCVEIDLNELIIRKTPIR